uniref:Uncharacterized protein n=1 Tax=Oncorhynchus kisutch TaxID=8019 RepID=A0A8C7D1S2_ONCKI
MFCSSHASIPYPMFSVTGNMISLESPPVTSTTPSTLQQCRYLTIDEILLCGGPPEVLAEVNAQKANNIAHHSTRQLEETISDFQRQKLEDIKRIFTDFITVEMVFHAKALEVYTHTFQNLDSMDIDKDLELFTGRIRVSDGPLDNQTLLPSSMAHQPSPTLGSSLKHTAESAKKSRSSILQRQRGVEEEEEDEEEEDESEIEAQQSRQSYASQYAQILRQKN